MRFKDLLGLKTIGVEFNPGSVDNTYGEEMSLIRLLKKKPLMSTRFPYLVVSDNYHDLASKDVDIVQITDIDQQLYNMLRHTPKKIGIEITVNKLRATESQKLARNIALIKSIYSFAEKYGNQLIMTSGASSIFEMVSGRCFDALLELCDIKPETYWNDLQNWLEHKISMRCYSYDT